jgi:putative flippase GtrA
MVVTAAGWLKPGANHAEGNRVNLQLEVPVAKVLRYSGASIIQVALGLLVLGVNVDVFHMTPTLANVVAAVVCIVPAFELNRRWVWRQQGRSEMGEFLPFCILLVAGLVLSTLAVRYAGDHSVGFANPWHTVVVDGANLGAYAVLWVVRYFVLDRVFTARRATPQGEAATPRLSPSLAAGSPADPLASSLATSLAVGSVGVSATAPAEPLAISSVDTGSVTVNTAPPPGAGDATMVP